MVSQVSFPGVVRNDSYEASCTVRLFNLVTLLGENNFTYTRMAIDNVEATAACRGADHRSADRS